MFNLTTDLYFTSCSAAARAVGGDLEESYQRIYAQLVNGTMKKAVKPAPNAHWKVPVQGLRDMGFNPDLTEANTLDVLLTPSAKFKLRDQFEGYAPASPQEAPADVIDTPAPAPTTYAVLDMLQAAGDEFIGLQLQNRSLRAQLAAEQQLRQQAEEHLADLRNILEYATQPEEKK